jgi:glutamate--cysteine ligase
VARGLGEEVHLVPLVESIATGKVQADRLLAAYEGVWGGSLNPVYEATSL